MSTIEYNGIILASKSPRRKTLLDMLGVSFTVQPSRIAELPPMGETPGSYSARLALEKAMEVAEENPDDVVIGADTVVAIDDVIMGKPGSKNEASIMLSRLSGEWHEVWTGVCLYHKSSNTQHVKAFCSQVRFKNLSTEEIDAYVQTGEPMDKAGAYAIQGKGNFLVKELKGSFHNVIGLPTLELAKMLEDVGVNIDDKTQNDIPNKWNEN